VYDDLPLNHPLRHLYRGLAGVIGLAMLGFGVTGLRGRHPLPGFAANVAFAVVAFVLGVVLVAGSLLWRQLSHLVYLSVGGALMVIGLALLTLLRTADFFGANMTSCLTTLGVGLAVFMAGTYTRTGTAEEARNRELERRGISRPTQAAARPQPATPARRRPAKVAPRRPAKTTRRPASRR
jgi:hypothetical protein